VTLHTRIVILAEWFLHFDIVKFIFDLKKNPKNNAKIFAQLQIPAEQIIAYVLLSYAQFIRFSKL